MSKPVILIVDDAPTNIDILRNTLQHDYKIKVAVNGQKAIEIANKTPDLSMILLDVVMPEMDGYEVCQILKKRPATSDIPIIFVTAKSSVEDENKGLELGAVDYISKPIQPAIVQARVKTHIFLANQQKHLEHLVEERTKEIEATKLEIIQCLGRAAEYKDNETGKHVLRMSQYSKLIAQHLTTDERWIDLLYRAAPMHDVGKIGIPDAVLLKPGKLDADEWDIMKQHPQIGAEILGNNNSEILNLAKEVAATHHEKWDGSGYPNGLKGSDIPLSGRIVAVADVFDALTCKRAYKKAWTFEDANQFIIENSGGHFDPMICDAFVAVSAQIRLVYNELAEDD